jgi:hypothetical protein
MPKLNLEGRYVAVVAGNGSWSVIDSYNSATVTMKGTLMDGLSEATAAALTQILNDANNKGVKATVH